MKFLIISWARIVISPKLYIGKVGIFVCLSDGGPLVKGPLEYITRQVILSNSSSSLIALFLAAAFGKEFVRRATLLSFLRNLWCIVISRTWSFIVAGKG